MNNPLNVPHMNSFIMGLVGGSLSSLLIVSFFILLTPHFRGKPYEIVTVDHTILKQRVARILAKENLNPFQEEQHIHHFWKTLQEKIHSMHPGKTTIVLTREAVLNMDLKDVTEALWKDVEFTFSRENSDKMERTPK